MKEKLCTILEKIPVLHNKLVTMRTINQCSSILRFMHWS